MSFNRKNDDNDDDSKGGSSKSRPFTAYDVQKVRLNKLFANIVCFLGVPFNERRSCLVFLILIVFGFVVS